MIRYLITDDGGFTGLAVAVACALALLLTAQAIGVQQTQSLGADVQYVADAAALAAGGVVSSWVRIVLVADACVVSMSIVGVLVLLVGTVLACIPATTTLARGVVDAGRRVLSARDSFADSAQTVLNTIQNALPLMVQAQAMSVADGQSREAAVGYSCLAIPVPIRSEPLVMPPRVIDDCAAQDVAESAARHAEAASEAADEAEGHLERAWRADCVDDPYSAVERAASLAGMFGASNPRYTSIEGWSFAVALDRARRYYAVRIRNEAPLTPTVDERVRSMARWEFYQIARELLESGSAPRSGDLASGLDLPLLPRNTSDIRSTALYRMVKYPVSEEAGGSTLHVDRQCPGTHGGIVRFGSFAQIESGELRRCDVCRWAVERVGEAPSASTAIANGFEHHYRIIAEAAKDYRESAERSREAENRGRRIVEGGSDLFAEAISRIRGPRFEPRPAGRVGVVIIAFDPMDRTIGRFPRAATVPGRLALSGARSSELEAESGRTVLDESFEKFLLEDPESSMGSTFGDLMRPAVALWGDALLAYRNGTEGLIAAADRLFSAVPGTGELASGWAGGFIRDLIEAAGLEPPDLRVPRPVLTNTLEILESDDSIGMSLAQVKRSAMQGDSGRAGGSDELAMVSDIVIDSFTRMTREALDATMLVGEVDLFGVYRIPIEVTIPPPVRDLMASGVGSVADGLRASLRSGYPSGWARWE